MTEHYVPGGVVFLASPGTLPGAAGAWTHVGHATALELEEAFAPLPPVSVPATVDVVFPPEAFRAFKPTHSPCLQAAVAIEETQK